MLRNEASIRELFYRSCIADRSFVPQDDRKNGYVMGDLLTKLKQSLAQSNLPLNDQ